MAKEFENDMAAASDWKISTKYATLAKRSFAKKFLLLALTSSQKYLSRLTLWLPLFEKYEVLVSILKREFSGLICGDVVYSFSLWQDLDGIEILQRLMDFVV